MGAACCPALNLYPFPPFISRLCLCSPPPLRNLPCTLAHGLCQQPDLSGTMMSTVYPSITTIVSSVRLRLVLSLSPLPCISPCSPGHEVTLARNTADVPRAHSPGNARRVCVCVFLWGFVWGIAARALACCALSARSFRFVCGVDVWLNGNWWVCKGLH